MQYSLLSSRSVEYLAIIFVTRTYETCTKIIHHKSVDYCLEMSVVKCCNKNKKMRLKIRQHQQTEGVMVAKGSKTLFVSRTDTLQRLYTIYHRPDNFSINEHNSQPCGLTLNPVLNRIRVFFYLTNRNPSPVTTPL